MKDERINHEDIEFLKIHDGEVFILGMRSRLIRKNTYFNLHYNFRTGRIIEEEVFQKVFPLNSKNPRDQRYVDRWVSLSKLG